jgi:hypothetical protein
MTNWECPSVGRKRIYESDAARVAACRARKNKKASTFNIAPELLKRLDDFMLARDETKSQVVERALRDFFRKR